MKLAIAIAFAFATSLALVNASAIQIAARAQPPRCTGGEVLEETTINHNGSSIQYASATCPGSGDSGNSAKRSKLVERQYVCTAGGCYVTCKELSNYNIYTSDCQQVLNYLDSYGCKLPDLYSTCASFHAHCTYLEIPLDGQPARIR